MFSKRACAASVAQLAVATTAFSVWPEGQTSWPLSRYFCRTLMAPSKKKLMLLSPGSPVMNSMLKGPLPSFRPRAFSMNSPWVVPTSQLSKVA